MADKTIKATLKVEDQFSKPLTKFQKGLGDVSKKSQITGQALAVMGTAAIAATAAIATTAVAMFKLADATAQMSDETWKASQQMGVSLEFYQKMQSAAGHAGTTISTFTVGMKSLVGQMQAVEEGSVNSVAAFEDLGISVFDANGEMRDQEEIFTETLENLADMDNITKRTALSIKLLGRGAQQFAPLLNEGSEAIREYISENETAVLVTEELALESERYNDQMQTLNESFQQTKNEGVTPLVTVFADFATRLNESEISSDIFITTLENMATAADVAGTAILDVMEHLGLITAHVETIDDRTDEALANMQRSADSYSAQNIIDQLANQNRLLEVTEGRLQEYNEKLASGEWSENATFLTEMNSKIRRYSGSVAILTAEQESRLTVTTATTSAQEDANEEYVKTVSLLDQFFIANERIIGSQAEVEAQQKASWDAMQQRWDEELAQQQIREEIAEEEAEAEQDAQRAFIAESINLAGDLASVFQSVHSAKMKAINEEFSAEERAIKNSTMSEKKKAKELEKLEKAKAKAEEEAQKRQLAYTVIVGAANTALAIQKGIITVLGVGETVPGGPLIKGAAMLSMAGVVGKYIGDIKSAQAQIPNREHGGAVRRGELYEVAENGKDELFESGGKSYLLPSQGGRVHSGGNSTSNSNVTINANFNGGDMATIEQRLPELVAKGMEMADRQGMMDYGGMQNFNRAVGN